ncbi:hypothetical protein [Nevskia ramosa]|uniref:hypothetical protein n=1 Tax=Nevskia ramosa TaxID=64002 RepID=UPI0023547B2F|nr:hypothetical protein [Nevskia ramosa]
MNLHLMKSGNGRRSTKVKQPLQSAWVKTREPDETEQALGASCVIERRDRDGVVHSILLTNHGEHYSQFGAPTQIMKDNEEVANAWHRELRDFGFKSSHLPFRQRPHHGRRGTIK